MFIGDLKRFLNQEAAYAYEKQNAVGMYDESGIMPEVVKFAAASAITAGTMVKISANNTVAACADGNVPVGVVLTSTTTSANVLVHGFVTVLYSGTAPSLGYDKLAVDDAGKLEKNNSGREFLVVNVDTTNTKVTILLK